MNHVTQPRLCQNCAAEAQRMAEQAGDRHVVKSCRHHGNRTVAIGFCQAGRIACYDLRGPLPNDAAVVAMLELIVKQLMDKNVMPAPAGVN